ncbi:ribose-5-phosphate isomerase-like isoform X2 [Panonychus citri]|nr:ribose-5-phosphate isomerase-like isoform X2 [Panonychus citri]
MVSIEEAKKIVGSFVVDDLLKDNMILGIGSGSTIIPAVAKIAEKVSQSNLKVKCVPTSFQARQLILSNNLPLYDLETCPKIDLTIDGADEVETKTKFCIKGGGGCLLQEKIVASASTQLAIICDYTKMSKQLGENWKKGIPIEVIPMSYVVVKNKIESKFGGQANLRMAKAKAGPLVTDNGNFILDWVAPYNQDSATQWDQINQSLMMIPGLVETGLFIEMVDFVYYADRLGAVHKI